MARASFGSAKATTVKTEPVEDEAATMPAPKAAAKPKAKVDRKGKGRASEPVPVEKAAIEEPVEMVDAEAEGDVKPTSRRTGSRRKVKEVDERSMASSPEPEPEPPSDPDESGNFEATAGGEEIIATIAAGKSKRPTKAGRGAKRSLASKDKAAGPAAKRARKTAAAVVELVPVERTPEPEPVATPPPVDESSLYWFPAPDEDAVEEWPVGLAETKLAALAPAPDAEQPLMHPDQEPPEAEFEGSLTALVAEFTPLEGDTVPEEIMCKREANTLDRIALYKAEGRLESLPNKLPPPEPPRKRDHADILVDAVGLVGRRMQDERRARASAKRKLSKALLHHFEHRTTAQAKKRNEAERGAREMAAKVLAEVRKKWQLAIEVRRRAGG